MTGQSVGLVFKRVARMLNVRELDPRRISGHLARIDGTQGVVEDGVPDAAIMRDAGWKDAADGGDGGVREPGKERWQHDSQAFHRS